MLELNSMYNFTQILLKKIGVDKIFLVPWVGWVGYRYKMLIPLPAH